MNFISEEGVSRGAERAATERAERIAEAIKQVKELADQKEKGKSAMAKRPVAARRTRMLVA